MMRDDYEIWDEFKWEEFMKEQDKKVELAMELFYYYRDDPNRDQRIASEMGWSWLLGCEQLESENTDDDEVEDGDEWKRLTDSGREELSTYLGEGFPVYQRTHELVVSVVRFVDGLPETKRVDSSVVDVVSNAMIASAKIAGGCGIDDVDDLGGSIAYCKRGLAAVNLSIAALYEIKQKNIIEGASYLELAEEMMEVRNLIALYVLELRQKFQRGF